MRGTPLATRESVRPLALLGGLVLPVAVFAACASAPTARPTDDTGSGTTSSQGPLSGTYSADSTAGTAPFVAVTFPDANHYQYVDKTCAQGPAITGDDGETVGLGDDPGDSVVDGNGTLAADAGADNCIHSGTYTVDHTGLRLTETGSSRVIVLPISALDPDGSEIGYPSDAAAKAALVVGAAALFGAIAINQFSIGGTDLRRTGLVDGTGVPVSSTSSGGSSGGITASDSGSLIVNTGDAGLLTDQAVALAEMWVAAKMPYCQAISGGREIDNACIKVHGSTCTRSGAANNVAWNAYRSDCSGLVSFAWSLSSPGLTTRDFVPGAAKYIPMNDLRPGDALLRPGHHIVLFKDWTDKSKGAAKVIAEPGCAAKGGPYAQEQSWSFNHAPGSGTNDNIAGGTYYAIRKK